ncbi:hypothetical protein ACJVC5_07710 [Peredibacter sp. HCB2-198]|uniref:hypothetical protein n=1 Tax=Peredibacter sp. HCB2-198 TaxID=3383025 RepID=UPI0038B536D5
MKLFLLTSFFIFPLNVFSAKQEIEVKYFNERFVWIKAPSKLVKARLNKPIDGQTICWVEVNSAAMKFDFISRRALSYDECLYLTEKSRKIIGKSSHVEIIGDSGTKAGKGNYYSFFDLLRNEKECVGYFGGCENFEKDNVDWALWKNKPISPSLYP